MPHTLLAAFANGFMRYLNRNYSNRRACGKGSFMICHAQRIATEKIIEEMERRAMPLAVIFVLALVAILVDFGLDTYAAHRHAGAIETAKIFAACLNGQAVQTEADRYATCNLHNMKLVEGIK